MSKIHEIEDGLARLSVRVLVGEAIMATCLAFVLKSLPAEIRNDIITELRAAIVVNRAASRTQTAQRERLLWTEHHAHQLIDQIERVSRFEP